MNDEWYLWLILVLCLVGIIEWIELDGEQQDKLCIELNWVCKVFKGIDGVEKINIGVLGNIVCQLYFYVIGCYVGDLVWFGFVWGYGQVYCYDLDVFVECVVYWKEWLGYLVYF